MSINPNISLICDWNNWNEETAIEGCIGPNGWKDLYGISTYDWYLQITRAYSNIFRTNNILSGTYVRDNNAPEVYLWNGTSLVYQAVFPHQKPVISLPQGWLQTHGYFGNQTEKLRQYNTTLPDYFSISQNFPNPFNPMTIIKYELPENSRVQLKIYDILGKEVAELVNEDKPAGYHEVEFNASSLPSGIYFYRIQAGSFVDTKKMILMK